ncbi:MAG: glycosyltransferase family 2 protein [Cyclobacteriaceae bacterium]
MNFLTVVGIFKNESHVIREWVEHYLNEGVDNFVLINNGSTDDFQSQIADFVDNGTVTIINDDARWAQIELYNKYFLSLKGKSQWILICDLDEFVYARKGYKTIPSVLKKLSGNVGVIRLPWKVYGSSGRVEQPSEVIPSFLSRAKQDGGRKPWMADDRNTLSKILVRPEFIRAFHIHFCFLNGRYHIFGPDMKELSYPEIEEERSFQPIDERLLRNSYLHLNHYPLQSRNWFLDVKSQRGAADTEAYDQLRDTSYFEKYDLASSDVRDNELSRKKYGWGADLFLWCIRFVDHVKLRLENYQANKT